MILEYCGYVNQITLYMKKIKKVDLQQVPFAAFSKYFHCPENHVRPALAFQKPRAKHCSRRSTQESVVVMAVLVVFR